MTDSPSPDEVRAIWEQNAGTWDDFMGEGNHYHLHLIAPTTERLLAIQPGERVLELACGNGSFARRLAAQGAEVLATDFSATFIERAQHRTVEHRARIDYRVVDATQRAELLALGEQPFDAAVSNMALMDMSEIEPLFEAMAQLLRPGGRFVFSLMHPAFNSVGTYKLVEEEESAEGYVSRYRIKVEGYLRARAHKGVGISGQTAPHYYFHRPLGALLAPLFAAGLVVDGLEEPTFPPGTAASRPLSWSNFSDFPPALIVRARRPG